MLGLKKKYQLLLQSLVSVIDQFLLSGLNFGIGLVLIRVTSKDEYGIYTQLFAAALLASTLLDALLGSPLTTWASRQSADERAEIIATALNLQWFLSVFMAVIFAFGCTATLSAYHDEAMHIYLTGVAYGLYVFSLTQREFFRTICFLEGKALKVLTLDGYFVVIAFFGGMALWHLEILTLTSVFFLLATANLFSNIQVLKFKILRFKNNDKLKIFFKEIWHLSRWAVPGALVGWAGNYSYLYLASIFLNLAASADLNASRLLLMPIALVGISWSRVVRPTAGRLIAQKNWQLLNNLGLKSVVGMELITCTYVVVLLLSFDWISMHILGSKYSNIEALVKIWSVYFAINVIRNIATSWMACYGAYSDMFWLGTGGLLLQWIFCIFMLPAYGAAGAVASLLAVEVIELLIFYKYLLPKARKTELIRSEI